ncbi:anti-CBASS protein Acb1 family protein [Rhizobium leguminosarum]|uniref:anti-CBASS protein Acb1 family protein n=1 Tax=Rhizobium leguminosarum TaxID=384 RepID=UPI00048831E7|nr:anti-CBASS Acb1 family protein [Rhizobium leguminosarum]
MSNVVSLLNYAQRRLGGMFPGFFPGGNTKHDHYKDFGYPETLTFPQLYKMYLRNGVATAGVDKTALKTWQDCPYLLEQERDGSETGKADETGLERDIRNKFSALRLWAKLAAADRMAMVGGYSGVILRLKDGLAFDQPVGKVPGGLDGLYKVDAVWAAQLTVAEYDTDPISETYGEPVMYQFNEAAIDTNQQNRRQLRVHPDRVIIWSEDGTINGKSILEPGYNDLIDMEKVKGGGGEGFWKNAKSAPVLEVDKDAKIDQMAKAMGVTVEDLADKMNEQVGDWNAGFDQLLMLMGMQAKTLQITLPSPEHFYGVPLQSFAASINMPVKILVGMQTGERASTEDAEEWAQTCMSRRTNIVHPNIMELVARLQRFGILPAKDWYVDQADLTESSMSEKIDRANKMADTNQKMGGTVYVFTDDEIRAAVGYEPLSDADKYRDDVTDDEATAAAGGKTPPTEE